MYAYLVGLVGTPRKNVFEGEPQESQDKETNAGDDGLDDRVDDNDDNDEGNRRPNDTELKRVLRTEWLDNSF